MAIQPPIFLDHNATSPLAPCVLEAMTEVWTSAAANPSSQHAAGRDARRRIEAAREEITQLLGGKTASMTADNLLFTSGGTEANNLALAGFADRFDVLLVSRIEHPSVLAVAEAIESQTSPFAATAGMLVYWLPAKADGRIDLAAAEQRLEVAAASGQRVFVTCMLANNETGVIQPVQELAQLTRRICGETGCFVHTDATQAVGKIPVSLADLEVDLVSFAGHKFHGPVGIGGLLIRGNLKPKPLLQGGFQQAALRPGTEPVALAVGLAKALSWWAGEKETRYEKLKWLREQLEAELIDRLPNLIINGRESPRLPHATNIAVPGVDRQQWVMALDFAGVACSSGSACASGSSEPSSVLTAMGLPKEVIDASIRLSVGAFTTAGEVATACDRIVECVQRLAK